MRDGMSSKTRGAKLRTRSRSSGGASRRSISMTSARRAARCCGSPGTMSSSPGLRRCYTGRRTEVERLARLLQSPAKESVSSRAMKLEISQPEGTPHQVELAGPEVLIGRDPSCDLVLSDERCSRRHAVLADGPEGLTIRDAGSANGIWVNGRQLRRSRLRPGDTVRLGDTVIRILPEAAETVLATAADLRRTAASSRAPSPPPFLRGRVRRPGVPRRRSPRRSPRSPGSPCSGPCRPRPSWSGGLLIAVRADAGFVAGALVVGAGLVLGPSGESWRWACGPGRPGPATFRS